MSRVENRWYELLLEPADFHHLAVEPESGALIHERPRPDAAEYLGRGILQCEQAHGARVQSLHAQRQHEEREPLRAKAVQVGRELDDRDPVVHEKLVIGLVRHALQLDPRRVGADERNLPVENEPLDGIQGDLGTIMGARRAIKARAVEVEQKHVARADFAGVRKQVVPAHHVARLLVPEIEQDAVADQPSRGSRPHPCRCGCDGRGTRRGCRSGMTC